MTRNKTVGSSILAAWLIATLLIELMQGRITPPGGLTNLDYLLIILLPLGSLLAGKYWQYKPLHFAYGSFGALIFLIGYTSGGRFALSLWMPADRNLWTITLGWCAFSVVMGMVCRSAASIWRGGTRREGTCGVCGYNLTGNVSGVCPECGTKVERA